MTTKDRNRVTITLTSNSFNALSVLSETCELTAASLVLKFTHHFTGKVLAFNEGYASACPATRKFAVNAIEARGVDGLNFFSEHAAGKI